MSEWLDIASAPKDGTWFVGRDENGVERLTQWGKTSHVPLYGWCHIASVRDDPDYDLWSPIEWRIAASTASVPTSQAEGAV